MYVFTTKADWDGDEDPVKAVARDHSLEALKRQGGFDGMDTSYHHRRLLEKVEPYQMTYLPSGDKVSGAIWKEKS